MAVDKETNEVLTKGVPKVIYEADSGDLPGFFSGKMDLTQLSNVADEVELTLEVKYSSGGTYRTAWKPSPGKQEDYMFQFTPLEETYGYRITAELLAVSPSATATLELLVLRSAVPA